MSTAAAGNNGEGVAPDHAAPSGWAAVRQLPAFLLLLTLLSIGALVCFRDVGAPLVGIDDANIFFVYGRNLAHGLGLVYNPGFAPVEGFSSLLWVLIVAAAAGIVDRFEPVLLVVSLVVVALSLSCLLRHVEDVAGQSPGSHVPLLGLSWPGLAFLGWTFCQPSLLCWSVLSLMETGVWTAALLASAVSTASLFVGRTHHAPRGGHIALLVVLVLARPEGVVFGALFWLLGIAADLIRRVPRAAILSSHAPPAVALGVTVASLTLFRLLYFGYPLPNTYYAKIPSSGLGNLAAGARYLAHFVTTGHLVMMTLVIAAVIPAARLVIALRRGRDSLEEVLLTADAFWSLVLLTGLLVPVLEGGDHFRGFRFFQPVFPILIIPALLQVDGLLRRLARTRRSSVSRWGWAVVGPVATILPLLANWTLWREPARTTGMIEFRVALRGRQTGDALNALFRHEPWPTVGVITAGGIKLTYRGPVNDLLGLNNPEMAHCSWDPQGYRGHAAFCTEVFFRQRPQLVLPRLFAVPPRTIPYQNEGNFSYRVLKKLLDDPQFRSGWEFAAIRLSGSQGEYMTAYFRRDLLEAIGSSSAYEVVRHAKRTSPPPKP